MDYYITSGPKYITVVSWVSYKMVSFCHFSEYEKGLNVLGSFITIRLRYCDVIYEH